MIELRYGPVTTEVRCDPLEYDFIRDLLTFEPEQPSLFHDDRFLSGLLQHVTDGLRAGDIEYEVIGAPEKSEGSPSEYAIPNDFLPGITMRDYQCMMVKKALWYRRGIIESPTGSGKCLAPETEVLLFDGRVLPARDLQVGHQLMGPDSKPRTVLSVSRGIGPMVKIVPVKGEPWRCNDVHVLTLVHTQTGEVIDVPLNEYVRKSKTFKHLYKLFQPEGVDFPLPQEPLTVSPYFLGVWLGDGRKGDGARPLYSVEICKPDIEIEQLCQEVAAEYNLRVSEYVYTGNNGNSKCSVYGIVGSKGGRNPLLDELRSLFPSGEVRIPKQYLLASREDRRALLAGLLDTDGHQAGGYYEIVQVRKLLADDIAFLARSLGFRVHRSIKKVNGVVYWRLSISGDGTSLPLRIPRKKPLPRRQIKNVLRTGFRVEPEGVGEYCGVTLDGDGRFLLGDFTVTHNTEITAAIAKWLQWKKGLGTLVLVPGITSMHQTIARLKKRGVSSVGGIGGGFFEPGQCMIAVINSIYKALVNRNHRLLSALDDIGCVIFMETHHLPARTWTYVGQQLQVPYRFGLSATPFELGEEPETTGDHRLIGVTGPVIARLPDSTLMNLGYLTAPKVHMLKVTGPFSRSTNWAAVKKNYLTSNESRNADIVRLCSTLSKTRRVLMLVSEIGHGKELVKRITAESSDEAYMFSGGSSLSVYRMGRVRSTDTVPVDELVRRLDGQDSYLLVGSPALDEDFDLPSIDVLIVAAFGKAFRRVVQRAGRILRVHRLPDGSLAEAHIIDFDDRTNVVLKRHSQVRRDTYLSRYGAADGFGIYDYRSVDEILRVLSVTNPT